MAVTFGFYNSLNSDRKYDAIQLSSIFDGIITDGLFRSIGTSMIVTASTGMIVVVGEGRAWFDHTWTLNDAPLPLELDASDMILNRIDTIVVDVDTRTAVRANNIIVVKGTPATTPAAPTLINADGHYQYPLCNVYVDKAATSIVQGKITNLVGTVSCPYITVIDAANEIGTRAYTEQNYVTDGESVTESLDALDTQVKAEIGVVAQGVANLGASKQNTITGGATTIASDNLAFSKALISSPSGKVAASGVSATELGYLAGVTGNIQTQLNSVVGNILEASKAVVTDATGKLASAIVTAAELAHLAGVTSNIQAQLNAKVATITGGATSIVTDNLTINRALISDANGKVAVSPVTNVKLGYVSDVTGPLQAQIDGKQPTITGAGTTIAAANLATNKVLVSDGSGKVAASASITDVMLGYLVNLTSDIQTQLNAKLGSTAQAADSLKVGGKKITVGTSAPASPAVGDVWIDTN